MSSETHLREAIQDSLKQLRDQHVAALDAVVNIFIEAAVAERDAEVAEARAQITAEAQQKIEKVMAEADKARDEAARARTEADIAREEAARARAEANKGLVNVVSDAHRSEREADRAGLSRLLEAVKALDNARSLRDVFDALAQQAGREAARAAVLLVRGERILGWRFVAFGDAVPDARRIELNLKGTGVIVEAVRSGMPRTVSPELSGFDFAPLPAGRAGLAVPVEVGGRIVAVVYADDGAPEAATKPSGTPSAWPEVVEILARHAARCLEAITMLHTAAEQQTAPSAEQRADASRSVSEPTVMGRVS